MIKDVEYKKMNCLNCGIEFRSKRWKKKIGKDWMNIGVFYCSRQCETIDLAAIKIWWDLHDYYFLMKKPKWYIKLIDRYWERKTR